MNAGTGSEVNRVETVRVTRDGHSEVHTHRSADVVAERRVVLYKASQVIRLASGVLGGLLGLRFVLKLMAANPGTPFARLVYGFTDLFLTPFHDLVATPAADAMVLELSTLVAMAVYALAAWVIVRALWVIFDKPVDESVVVLEEHRQS